MATRKRRRFFRLLLGLRIFNSYKYIVTFLGFFDHCFLSTQIWFSVNWWFDGSSAFEHWQPTFHTASSGRGDNYFTFRITTKNLCIVTVRFLNLNDALCLGCLWLLFFITVDKFTWGFDREGKVFARINAIRNWGFRFWFDRRYWFWFRRYRWFFVLEGTWQGALCCRRTTVNIHNSPAIWFWLNKRRIRLQNIYFCATNSSTVWRSSRRTWGHWFSRRTRWHWLT